MLLTDKLIKDYIESKNILIIEGYDPNNIGVISYDITIDYIVLKAQKEKYELCDKFQLPPTSTVFIRTKEKLCLPDNITARVVERNSLMRQGLFVSGPHYQPGHTTYMFLRVKNVSDLPIDLESGTKIAQLEFVQLDEGVLQPYGQKKDDKYQGEEKFIANGDLDTATTFWDIKESIQKLQQKIQKIDKDSQNYSLKIYANILTLMGIFIGIFALIVIDTEAIIRMNILEIISINLALCAALFLLFGLVIMVTGQQETMPLALRRCIITAAVIFIISIGISLAVMQGSEKESVEEEEIYEYIYRI